MFGKMGKKEIRLEMGKESIEERCKKRREGVKEENEAGHISVDC